MVPVWRTSVSPSVLGLAVCAAAALATSLAFATPAAAECPNEALRLESNVNPSPAAEGKSYSQLLPDCRAYEMVSPLYKQTHDAVPVSAGGHGLPVAPGGETVGWSSLGSFSNPENYQISNAYLSQRAASEWTTSSAFAPRSLVDGPFTAGIENDSSPDLRSVRVTCGSNPEEPGQRGTGATFTVACARREAGGSWSSTPGYREVEATPLIGEYLGGSSDLSHLFILPEGLLLSADHVPDQRRGIYEIGGCCTASSALRLVNVDNEGNELVRHIGEEIKGPLLGDRAGQIVGSTYHAISESGGAVFFTATPNSPKPEEKEVLTVYARINNGETFETVAVSNPSHEECSACNEAATRENATFQGASADGSKVFFTTKQQLLSKEKDPGTLNLYEYDFNRPPGQKLVLLSPQEAGANVTGVVRNSPDGSHVYFVATGVLANGATKGLANLYGYDTITEETKFVAARAGVIVEGIGKENEGGFVSTDSARHAQTTPDGRYLVFSSQAQLAGDTNEKGCPSTCPQAVYRYDFETGGLTWVSKAAPAFTPVAGGEGEDAFVPPLPASVLGADANIDDWNRAISENGEYIIFTTKEKLQANDGTDALDVYEWHNGTVSMISDGRDPRGIPEDVAMSASGSDIFFITATELVGQDTDVLRDVYDARVGGGFAAPTAESSCSDVCQGVPSAPPSFPSAASSLFSGGQNLTAQPNPLAPARPKNTKPKPLTRAQLLAKALKACKGKPKSKRKLCQAQARKKYGAKTKAKKIHRRSK
jgi:WD40-like Beta Propeller Repeat